MHGLMSRKSGKKTGINNRLFNRQMVINRSLLIYDKQFYHVPKNSYESAEMQAGSGSKKS